MGRYYVAGIPFDSENSLKHYGVKNMEWGKHKFGLDADPRYIKWLKDAGKNIGSFATNAVTKAAQAVGSAVNKGANFVTGNQDRANAAAKRSEATSYNRQAKILSGSTKNSRPSQWFDKDAGLTGRDFSQQIADQQRVYASKAANANKQANEYERRANNALIPTVSRTANNVAGWATDQVNNIGGPVVNAAQTAGNWIGDRARDVGNWAGQTARNVGDAAKGAAGKIVDATLGPTGRDDIRNAASKATKEAKGFLNSAGKWVSNAAGNVKDAAQNAGNAIGEAANNARGGIGGFFDRVGDTVRGAADSVGDWGREAAGNIGGAISGAADNVRDWAGQQAQNVGGAVQNAGNWIGDRARDVGEAVSGAAGKVADVALWPATREDVANAAGNVRDWAGQQAQNVGGFFDRVGDWGREAAKNVGGAISGAAGNVRDWAGQTAGNIGNFVTGDQARKDLNDAQNAFFYSQGRVNNAQNAYDKTLPGMIENAPQKVRDWAGQQAQNVGGFFDRVGELGREAAGNVRDWAGQTAGNVGGWIGDRVNDVGGAISGAAGNVGDYLGNKDDARRAAEISDAHYDPFNKTWDSPESEQAFNDAVAAYNNSLQTRLRNATNDVGDWTRNTAPGLVNQAGQWLGKQAQNVGGAISGAAGNVRDWAGQAAQNVGNFVSEIANPHYQLNTQQMMDNYRQYLNDHPENLQSPQHAEWLRDQIRNDPQLRAYYEQNIREQTIPEQTIPEQTIPEQRISNRSEELDMDRLVNDVYPGRYKDFEDYYNYRISDPRWQNYTREDLTDDLIRMGYNKRISHSALNEKPDSVSDAFWAKFTADGGTREDYERDWR